MPFTSTTPPWPPMHDPAMRDDHIELFVADVIGQLTARTLYRHGDLPHEATYLYIPQTYRDHIPAIAHTYQLPLEPINRYTVSATGETQQLVISCPAVPDTSLAAAIANTYTRPEEFTSSARAALNQLYEGPYGTDPNPDTPASEALAVLIRDSGLLPVYDGVTTTNIWPLASLYAHITQNNLDHVSQALARKA